MRLTLAAVAGLFLLAAPAHAVTVESRLSEDFQEKITDDYGVREAAHLTDTIARKIESRFAREGVQAARVVVTIEDARPNRPTMNQVSNRPGLDPFRSVSLGGAKLTGIAYDASGAEIGSLEYKWYETDISMGFGLSVWHDANWAIDRFARRFADKLAP